MKSSYDPRGEYLYADNLFREVDFTIQLLCMIVHDTVHDTGAGLMVLPSSLVVDSGPSGCLLFSKDQAHLGSACLPQTKSWNGANISQKDAEIGGKN